MKSRIQEQELTEHAELNIKFQSFDLVTKKAQDCLGAGHSQSCSIR